MDARLIQRIGWAFLEEDWKVWADCLDLALVRWFGVNCKNGPDGAIARQLRAASYGLA